MWNINVKLRMENCVTFAAAGIAILFFAWLIDESKKKLLWFEVINIS